MTTKVMINRLSTGVPGLDEVLGGGLPEFSFNLIAGQPGSGKTTLAHQMMFAMATSARPALYFTVLGEPPLKMLRYQQQFEFFRDDAIEDSVRFINLGKEAEAGDLESVLARIITEVEAHAPGLVFVDSFRSVAMNQHDSASAHWKVQSFVQRLGMLMTSWQATTFLIGEYDSERDTNPIFTISDGLIWLRQTVQRNSMVRKIEVAKMRGQALRAGLHTFRIAQSGISVFPPAGVTAAKRPLSAEALLDRASTGVPELDRMLGGGIPRGYSVLVAGPSGSGKTILAASFLAAGARSGEKGVIASFEQNPGHSKLRQLSDLVTRCDVRVTPGGDWDVSMEEVVQQLLDAITATNATRVVVDSLSALELALAPNFRADFRESLAQVVNTLTATGVTVLMTSELEDRYIDLRFSPYGTAFMTDVIIVQRYIEVQSRLRRVMAVVKVRASEHSDELRLFSIDHDGIQIGAAMPAYEGMLGGRPTILDNS